MTKLKTITAFLDKELQISLFNTDHSNNGLQIENSGSVHRVYCGVDASMELFKTAKKGKADLVVCHHGISWDDSLKRITDINYRKIKFLMDNDIALYACHLPLDAHPVHGNNILICRALGLRRIKKFGMYNGMEIGFSGSLPRPMIFKTFQNLVKTKINKDIRVMNFGKKKVSTVAVISGGAADELVEAGEKKIDVFLSGEPKLSAYISAQEYGINAVFAGHYATEMFGVRAVAGLLKRKFKLDSRFIDLKVPF